MSMAKRVLITMLALALALSCAAALADESNAFVTIGRQNFPDEMFRIYVEDILDRNSDGVLTPYEIRRAKTVDVSDLGIKSLKGIEKLKSLTWLACGGNRLTELDLTQNTNLVTLECQNNKKLTSLKLPQAGKMETLWCFGCNLDKVVIGKNGYLKKTIRDKLFYASDKIAAYGYAQDTPVITDIKTNLMSGKKRMRGYMAPWSFKFNRARIAVKVGKQFSLSSKDVWFDMWPITAVYPIKLSSSDPGILGGHFAGMEGTFEAHRKGAAYIVATCAGMTAKIQVIVH